MQRLGVPEVATIAGLLIGCEPGSNKLYKRMIWNIGVAWEPHW